MALVTRGSYGFFTLNRQVHCWWLIQQLYHGANGTDL